MALQHAQAGEVIDIRPLASALAERRTTTLVKTDELELVRLVLPAGHEIATHLAPGPITIQCLEGSVRLTALGKTQDLSTGTLVHLEAAEPHAVRALADSSLLVTFLLRRRA